MELKDGTKLIKLLLTENKEITNMSDEEILEAVKEIMKTNPYMHVFNEPSSINSIPEIVYCRDCIHRPVYDEEENDLIVPPYNNEHQDCACPYICEEDFYLSKMPDKDFYCKFGEKK